MTDTLLDSVTHHRTGRFERKRTAIWLATAVAASLGLVIAALAVRGDNSGRSNVAVGDPSATSYWEAAEPSPGLRSPAQAQQRIEVEVITIRPSGFEPLEITRPKGLFVIAVENRSGLQVIQLRLDREAGPRVRDFQMPRNKHDWKDGFDLTPGRYVLSEAYHPNWTCNITITSK